MSDSGSHPREKYRGIVQGVSRAGLDPDFGSRLYATYDFYCRRSD